MLSFNKKDPRKTREQLAEETFESKAERVRQHIREVGWITSVEAIKNYWATRLSAVIYDAKKEHGGTMNIGTFSFFVTRVDENGRKHTSRPACYYDADRYTEEEIRQKSGLL